MARLARLSANLFAGWFQLRRRFSPALLDEITEAIATGERTHLGEVRFAVESRLPLLSALHGLDPSERARQVFAQLRVWDTEHNSGVLFYLLLAEHRVEIVADRGIAARVSAAEWATVCQGMRDRYARNEWREGSLHGITAAHALLARHFPATDADHPDELPDRPVLL